MFEKELPFANRADSSMVLQKLQLKQNDGVEGPAVMVRVVWI